MAMKDKDNDRKSERRESKRTQRMEGEGGYSNGRGPTVSHGSAPSGGPTASRSVDTTFHTNASTKPSSGWNGRSYTPDSKA